MNVACEWQLSNAWSATFGLFRDVLNILDGKGSMANEYDYGALVECHWPGGRKP